jgi:SPP1 gp7 family putative phage head morphogenesis protein
VAVTANDQLLDQVIRHQVYLERFKASELPGLIKQLNSLDADLLAQLASSDVSSWTGRRLEAQIAKVSEISDAASARYQAALNGTLEGLAGYEGRWSVATIAHAIGEQIVVKAGLDLVTPAANLLKAAITSRPLQGKLLRDWVKDLEKGRRDRLSAAIRMAAIESQTTGQLIQRIRGTTANNYADGILQVSRSGAEALARTAIQHVSNAARAITYDANGAVIDQVQWVSTLDGRTTSYCRAMDGKTFPINSGPRPPAHINCRSTTVPVLKSWDDIGIIGKDIGEGTRASMNGQVPDTLDYDGWLRKQTTEFQDEVLGKAKADLFRAGLKMDKFVDLKTGHSFTLAELEQREPAVWAKARGPAAPAEMEVTDTSHPTPGMILSEGRVRDANGHIVGVREIEGSGKTLPKVVGDYGSLQEAETAVRRYMKGTTLDKHDAAAGWDASTPIGGYEHMTAIDNVTHRVPWVTTSDKVGSVGPPDDLMQNIGYRKLGEPGAIDARRYTLWHNHPSPASTLSGADIAFVNRLPQFSEIVAEDMLGNVFRSTANHFATDSVAMSYVSDYERRWLDWSGRFSQAVVDPADFGELADVIAALPQRVESATGAASFRYRDEVSLRYGYHLAHRLLSELGWIDYRYTLAPGEVMAQMDGILDDLLKQEGATLADLADSFARPGEVDSLRRQAAAYAGEAKLK